MGILHGNEKYTRKLCKDLSESLGVPYDLVRNIVDGIGLHVLSEIAEEGKKFRETGEKGGKFKIELPMIGTLICYPKKYPETENSILNGWAIRTKFEVREPYLLKMRMAYYTGEDYVSEALEKNFSKFIIDKYSRIISEEGKDEFEGDEE